MHKKRNKIMHKIRKMHFRKISIIKHIQYLAELYLFTLILLVSGVPFGTI